jgi:alpha-1,2-mannosyltransferase
VKRQRWEQGIGWAAGVASVALTLYWAIHISSSQPQVDIDVYLMGGAHVLGPHLYNARLPGTGLRFTYPPFAALPFAPLSLFVRSAVQVLWSCVNVAALFALLLVSLRALRPNIDRGAAARWSMILVGPAAMLDPVRQTIGFGQINLLLVLLILFDLTSRADTRSRWFPRGALVGLAAAVKLTPLVFVPYLFLTKQTRAAWAAITSFGALVALAGVVAPRASWAFWTKYVFVSRAGPAQYIADQNVRGVAIRLHHAVVPGMLLWLLILVIGAFGLAVAATAYRRSSPFLGVLVCATTGLLVSPITWSHHLVWVVPVLVWLVIGPDRPAFGVPIALGGFVLFRWAPIWRVPYSHNRELTEHGWQLLAGGAYFWAMVAFVVGIAIMLGLRGLPSGAHPREPRAVGSPVLRS